MSVTFTPNVPLANQSISGTQPIINNNFLCLDNDTNGFTVDHQSMTDLTNGGKHKWVTLLNVSSDPSLTYPISRIYEKTFGSSPNFDLELYWATPRQNAQPQINRLIPSVKAMAMWTSTNVSGVQPFVTGALLINVNEVMATGAPTSIATITFTTPLDYDNYYIFTTANTPNSTGPAGITVNGFTIRQGGLGSITGFMVI